MSPSPPPSVQFPNPHAGRTLAARWWPGVRPFACSPIRVAGMLPVILVLGLHALAYITAVNGSLAPLFSRFPFAAGTLLLLFHFFFLSSLANYVLLVVADPGSPPEDWQAPAPVIAIRNPPPSSLSSNSSSLDAPPEYPLPPVENGHYILPFRHAHLMRERTLDGYLRYCDVCRAYKPDRSHHCSVCRRCILRMDHHCVFINNCVSFYNHKFFINFVLFAFLGCATAAIVAFPTFADIVAVVPTRLSDVPPRGVPSGAGATTGVGVSATTVAPESRLAALRHFSLRLQAISDRNSEQQPVKHTKIVAMKMSLASLSAASSLSVPVKTAVMIGYITSTSFAFALAVFVSLHFFLVSKGRTTIEMYEMADRVRAQRISEYDLGCWRNFRNVFGPVVACWPLPTRAYIPGDGLSYDRRTVPPPQEGVV